MKVELLAPAGSYEALEAAFEAGADAVYLGGQKFGARAYADNLDQEQLIRAIDLAHLKKTVVSDHQYTVEKQGTGNGTVRISGSALRGGTGCGYCTGSGCDGLCQNIFSGVAYSCQYADDDHRCGERKAFTESRGNPCGDCEGAVTGRN